MLQPVLRRARTAGRRWAVLGSLTACVIATMAVADAAPSGPDRRPATAVTTTSPLVGFTVQVGPEERVYGPSNLTDSPYFSERHPSGRLYGFISNNDAYRVSTRNNRKVRDPKLILKRGDRGDFDRCGAWLLGSVLKRTPRRWVALYHAEAAGRGDNNECIFDDDSVVASVGRAVSNDAGRSWRKTGQVVTQDRRLDGPKTEDATLGRVVRYGKYIYLFYGASTYRRGSERDLHVARSRVADAGRRGTWRKWHCYKPSTLADRVCGFGGKRNAGLGGRSTPIQMIDPKARVIIPNTYLHHAVAFSATGTRGFRLWVSNTHDVTPPLDPADPTSEDRAWAGSIQIYPPVTHADDPRVDNWDRTRRAKQLYAYPSIVGARGSSSTTGRVFYVYYVKLFEGDPFSERHLMRRRVTITKADPSRLHRVALTTYVRAADGRRRTTTERPAEKSFKARSNEGYLLSNGELHDGWLDVFECKLNGRYLLRTGRCRPGESKYRRVGWISPEMAGAATVPIYRCYNRAKRNHFASTDRQCQGFRRQVLLGYGLPSL